MHIRFAVLLSLPLALAGCSSGPSSSSGSSGSGTKPPVANAAGPYSGKIGVAVSFSGGNSSDPQGQPLTYAWNFGDSSTGSGVNPTHTYTAAGTYTVSLTVTDTSNLTASATTTSTITAQAPIANAGGPYSGHPAASVSFNGSGSTDPQGQTLTYAWNFGDSSSGTGVSPIHTYTAGGTYTVSLTVTDTSSLTASATTTATITALPPVANAGGPYSGLSGASVSFSGSGSSDPQGQSLTYAWNFGDNSTGTGVSPTHIYSASGTYTVSLTVTDTSNLTATASTTSTIGTTGATFSGTVHSGNQIITGAHVYLFVAGTTGYGQPSQSVLSNTGYSDSTGSYVPTTSTGSFTIPAGYACPNNAQAYIYALDGTIGTYTNSGTGLLAALGPCSQLGSISSVWVNEVSTIAAAYALSGFATDATHISSSGTALALTGVANAFANAANLVSLSTGTALATTPAGNGTVPQTTLNTLADILSACVSSAGSVSTQCSNLFTNAKSGGSTGTSPTDTATAAINIAHNPAANIAALFGSPALTSPFSPALTALPNDLTICLRFTGGGISSGNGAYGSFPHALAIDAFGNAWVTTGGDITKLSSNGTVLSPGNGYGGTTLGAGSIAIDASGNAWVGSGSSVVEFSNAGSVLNGPGYTAGGDLEFTNSIAIDSLGRLWVTDQSQNYRLVVMSNQGNVSFTLGNGTVNSGGIQIPAAITVDAAGSGWIVDQYDVVKVSSSGGYLSGPGGFGYAANEYGNVAIDSSGNAWIPVAYGLAELSNAGNLLSSAGGFSTGNSGQNSPSGVAIDGSGTIWSLNDFLQNNPPGTTSFSYTFSLARLSGSGGILSGTSGYGTTTFAQGSASGNLLNNPIALAIDGSGDVWVANSVTSTCCQQTGSVVEFIGVATPVVTPVVANLLPPYTAPASKP